MSKDKEEHIHKYRQVLMGSTRIERDPDGKKRIVKKGGYPVFKCVLPGCTHYIARDLAFGRQSLCWVCDSPLVMNPRTITQTRPKHINCKVGSKTIEGAA